MSNVSKKDTIIAVAMKYFSLYGYESTSLESIAQECTITKPAIYYHFKDKASLYQAVICPKFQTLAEKILANTTEGFAQEKLHNYIKSFGDFLITHPTFNAVFAREMANGANTLPSTCSHALSLTLTRLMEILQEGERQGVFEKENPFMIQLMIVATLTSYNTTKPLRKMVVSLLQETHELPNPSFENVIDSLSRKIIKGLQC